MNCINLILHSLLRNQARALLAFKIYADKLILVFASDQQALATDSFPNKHFSCSHLQSRIL